MTFLTQNYWYCLSANYGAGTCGLDLHGDFVLLGFFLWDYFYHHCPSGSGGMDYLFSKERNHLTHHRLFGKSDGVAYGS